VPTLQGPVKTVAKKSQVYKSGMPHKVILQLMLRALMTARGLTATLQQEHSFLL